MGVRSAFSKQLISYILLLLLPAVIIGLLYTRVVESTTTLCLDSCQSALKEVCGVFDGYIASFDNMAVNTSMGADFKKVNAIGSIKSAPKEVYDVWRFSQSQASTVYVSRDLEYDYQIFFRDNELVVRFNTALCGLEQFFNTSVRYEALTFQQWYDLVFADGSRRFLPLQPVKVSQLTDSALTYLVPVRANAYDRQVSAVFSFQIRKRKLDDLFAPALMDGQGCAYLLDESGNVIYASVPDAPVPSLRADLSAADTWQQDDRLYAYQSSNYGAFSYLIALPKSVVLAQLYSVTAFCWFVIAAYILVSVVLAVCLAWQRSKPLRELTAKLSSVFTKEDGPARSVNEYEFIAQNMLRLIDDNQTLRTAGRSKDAALSGIALERLLTGVARPGDSCPQMLALGAFPIHASCWAVAVARAYATQLSSDGSTDFPIFDLAALVRQTAEEPLCFVYPMDSQTIALVYSFESGDAAQCRRQMDESLLRIDAQIAAHQHIHPYLGCGSCFDDLYDLHFSYDQAILAVSGISETNAPPFLTHYEPQAGKTALYYFPIDLEYRLINCVKAGQVREARALLDQLRAENFDGHLRMPAMMQMFCADLQACLFKLCGDLGVWPLPACGEQERDPMRRYDCLCAALLDLTSQNNGKKRSHNHVLKEKMLEYIEQNHTNQQLCVAMIAEAFNLSESYFSDFFKMQTGENFSAYLEKMRIRHAKALLENDQALEVEAIAQYVGYGNPNTFRRAFKRVVGYSPSVYRKQMPKGDS